MLSGRRGDFGGYIKVQEIISSKVEEITGKEVAQVNVNVVDLVHEADEEDEEETEVE